MFRYRIVALVCLFTISLALSVAQETLPEPEGSNTAEAGKTGLAMDFGLGTVGMWNLELYGGLKGFELVPGAGSRALLYAGGGYVGDAHYRTGWGSILPDGSPDAGFKKTYGSAKLGLDLGILPHPDGKKNRLYSQLFLKSIYEAYVFAAGSNPAIQYTNLGDRAGSWTSSLFGGLYWDDLAFNPGLQCQEGLAAELSLEWTPGLAMNQVFGANDYLRVNAAGRLYLPLLETADYGLYFTDRMILDALFGYAEGIGGKARRTVGGFNTAAAPGGSVRGIDAGRYDSFVKFINNADLRFHFLPLFRLAADPESPVLVPEVFAFFDAALVDNLDYRTNRLLSSTGGGLILNLRFAGIKFDLGYYVSYAFADARANWFNLVIGAHHY